MSKLKLSSISICFSLLLTCAQTQGSPAWYHQRVTWQYGSEGCRWETSLENPNTKEHYTLALVPLWALEGGIIAMEISIANPAHPEDNLLGERNDSPQPFVIEVAELQRGIKRSRFGPTRTF